MTIQEMQRTDKAVLLPDDIAEVLGVNPQSIRDQVAGLPGLRDRTSDADPPQTILEIHRRKGGKRK